MANLVLRRNLSESSTPFNLVLSGAPIDETVTSIVADIYWRFEDDPTSEPQLLGSTRLGGTLEVPFDMQDRAVRFYGIPRTPEGHKGGSSFGEATQYLFELPNTAGLGAIISTLTENVTKGMLIDLYSGVTRNNARRADASLGQSADGFTPVTASSGTDIGVYTQFGKEIEIPGAALSIGTTYFLGTAGGLTASPSFTDGYIIQEIGIATRSTTLLFQPSYPIIYHAV